ncbi:MAG: hypothetical protein ACRDYZ_06790 [Acidimicrobiales bacterium]
MGELDIAPQPGAPPPAGPSAGGRPVPRPGPGLRPALVVVGLAVVILVVFGVGSALSGNGTHHGAAGAIPAGPTPVAGTTLDAVPAATALAPIRQPGAPPTNIIRALAVPAGATRVAHSPTRSITLFDANVRFTVPGTQSAVVHFYRTELAATGWKLTSVGPARGQRNATEVLAQKAGTDGWYWEAGVVVSPTAFGTGAGSATTGATPFELRLFQVNDAS